MVQRARGRSGEQGAPAPPSRPSCVLGPQPKAWLSLRRAGRSEEHGNRHAGMGALDQRQQQRAERVLGWRQLSAQGQEGDQEGRQAGVSDVAQRSPRSGVFVGLRRAVAGVLSRGWSGARDCRGAEAWLSGVSWFAASHGAAPTGGLRIPSGRGPTWQMCPRRRRPSEQRGSAPLATRLDGLRGRVRLRGQWRAQIGARSPPGWSRG